jgi:hypothetical protein
VEEIEPERVREQIRMIGNGVLVASDFSELVSSAE